MLEQRLTIRLTKHWNMVRKEHKIPEIQRFSISAIEDIWPQCLLLRISGQGHALYQYEYMGQSVKEIYGRDLTGTYIDDRTHAFPSSIVIHKLPELAKNSAPVNDNGHFINEHGKMIKYRACLLPIGTEKELTHIVVGLSYRAF